MNTFLVALAHWFARKLYDLGALLERMGVSDEAQSKFVNLAPTEKADKAGVYSDAIHFATNDKKVTNIALTGPYGSGKSSIIQSFMVRYRPRALHISLAAFVSEDEALGRKTTRQEIERSILQQMLYGADANKLPLSRFKRIQSPGVWSVFKSLFIMLGILSLWYVFHQRGDVVSGTFFDPVALSNWLNLVSFAIAGVFFWMALHHFYVASFGVSLKSVSLKDIEIRPAGEDQESILNRHLDEIIYFFQSTDYDLVVVEDLDRFNDAEIFTTLREINGLVNENAGVKRTIRFLYALRDDMFVNTDRTKFFEFIIPVIPIINPSNSIDMVLEQGKRLKLDERLDRQFLREVSRYLNDLRLIQNIFNEYVIYVANLEADEENLLDANKLLAILIYKNVYPRDFEELHRGEGNLAEILGRKDDFIAHGEAEFRADIGELEHTITIADSQTPSDLKELRQIYAMALIERLPSHVVSLGLNWQNQTSPGKLAEHVSFEQLIDQQTVSCRMANNTNQNHDISGFQRGFDSQRSNQQRNMEIQFNSSENKTKTLGQINGLRSRIATLRTTKLSELLRLNASRADDLFEEFGENGELARYLILEGHLDDTYYQYTSLFHSGRLSPHDNKFLIQIRAFVTPDPSFPIDNPKEVIAAMRDVDFGQSYVLNVKLVDSLMSDPIRYQAQTERLFEYLSSEFENNKDFNDPKYAIGHHVTKLLDGLAASWEGLIPAALASQKRIAHVTQILVSLHESSLTALASIHDELPKYVAANLPEILARRTELAPERLKHLNFEVADLAAIKEHSETIRCMLDAGLFELTIANIEYVYQLFLGERALEPLRERNFISIRSTKNAILMERVERDFDLYLRDVLLELPDNTKEDASAIADVGRRDQLDQDDLRKFLERQTTLLPSLIDVPERLHSMLFRLGIVEPTWVNCLKYLEGAEFEAESLVEYLDRDDVRSTILKHPIPDDAESKQLRLFLIKANSMSNVAYREYVHLLPKQFKFVPESLEQPKLRILIDEEKITFTPETLDAFAESRELQVRFIAINIGRYLENPDSFALDDGFREELLRSDISQTSKLELVALMDLSALVDLQERAALIGPIIETTDVSKFSLDSSVAQSLIEHSRPVLTQISLFNKCQSILTNDEAHQVLTKLPKPFSEIRTGYNTPRLSNTPENLNLVSRLDSRDINSSRNEGGYFSDDIKVNLKRS